MFCKYGKDDYEIDLDDLLCIGLVALHPCVLSITSSGLSLMIRPLQGHSAYKHNNNNNNNMKIYNAHIVKH